MKKTEVQNLVTLAIEIPLIKDDGNIKDKQASIAAVREQYLKFVTFPTPHLSNYGLPIKYVYRYIHKKNLYRKNKPHISDCFSVDRSSTLSP